jgi:hypothetical protein
VILSPGLSDLFPGHQRTSTSTPYEEELEQKLENKEQVPEVSESEWETDVTEDEQETKPNTPKLEDALAKLDNLDLDSDDDMRYKSYARTAAKKEVKAAAVEPKVIISEPTLPVTNGTTTNGFHKEAEVEEEVEVAEEAVPTSTFISEMVDIDDLLMKGSHFVALDSSPVFFNDEEESTPKTLSGDFSNAKPIADILQVDQYLVSAMSPPAGGPWVCSPSV